MSETITPVRRGVALLFSAMLFLQACTAATAPGSFPSQNQFDRGLVEGTIELKVDAGMSQPLVDAEEARRLQEAEVIPLRLVIRNLGTSEVIVESAGMTLELNDGRPDRKSTRLNSSHLGSSYAVFCLKKKKAATTTCTCQ